MEEVSIYVKMPLKVNSKKKKKKKGCRRKLLLIFYLVEKVFSFLSKKKEKVFFLNLFYGLSVHASTYLE